MNDLSLISVIVPCRNEEQFIRKCLDSIISNDYPKDRLQVLVVDGMSEDSTRQIIESYQKQYSFMRAFENPLRITSCALNLGIESSEGDLLLWLSAHNVYESQYISKCVRYLKEYKADAVGGIIKPIPRKNGSIGKAVCIALSHPFGVGNSAHKIGASRPQWADTAFGTCYRREVFEKIGTFNENLVRGQDMEFASRLKKAGLKNLLVPELKSYYYAHSDLSSLWRHCWKNGVWAILPFLYSEVIPVSWRHLVPLAFVSSLAVSALLGLMKAFFWWVFLGIAVVYAVSNLVASSQVAWRKRDFRYLVVMALVFVVMHVSYGLGSVWGSIKLLTSSGFWKKLIL
jgi:glycosyltransferase involved in cell wall biosynthesis